MRRRRFEINLLARQAVDIDPPHAGNRVELFAHAQRDLPHLGHAEAVCGDRQRRDGDVAEIVVDRRAAHAIRQRRARVGHLVAQRLPVRGEIEIAIVQLDADDGAAGERGRGDALDFWHFPDLLFERPRHQCFDAFR